MQRHLASTLACVIAAATTAPAAAQDAQAILDRVRQTQIESLAGVDCYAVDQSLVGNRMTLIFRRTDVTGPDGKPATVFQGVSSCTPGSAPPDAGADTATMMNEYARGLEMTGDALSTEIDKGLEQAGLPPGLLTAMGGDPWVSPDPRTMMGGMADFARAAGTASGESDNDEAAIAQTSAAGMAEFASRAKLVGTETIDGRTAFHVRADGLNHVQQSDGQTFETKAVSVWIDSSAYVPLRTVIDGVATSAGNSRPVTIEKIDADYRSVPGSRMYQPYRQRVRMQGTLTPEQERQMAEAKQQLAQAEQQIEQMQPAQRQMMMNQMGPQLEMMRKMAAGAGMEVETVVNEIVVNPDQAALQKLSARPADMPAAPPLPAGAAAAAPVTTQTAAPVRGEADARKAAQQACLAEKVRQAEEARKKKRGLGSLMSAAGRVAARFGGADATRAINDVYAADATAEDLASAARDLGLTEEDVAACQNPQ